MLTPDRNDRFISILADGKFHENVREGTDGASLRQYETSKGEKGEKWELTYQKIEARIVNIEFHDGDFGKNILITFQDDDGNEVVLSQGTATNFGEDLMKKLPSVNFAEKVTAVPYAFEDDRGRPKRGVNLYQDGKKLTNFFYKPSEVEGERGTTVNGYPEPEGDTSNFSKDDWKIHFLQARKFLINYIETNILSKFAARSTARTSTVGPLADEFGDKPATYTYPESPTDEINPEDIPF
jgi:hypothetical protein